jgi:ABC-2 type transport system permease protein
VTPFGFAPVVLCKGVDKVVRTFLILTVVLAAILFVSGTALQLNVVTVVTITTLAIATVLGLGLVTGGVAILYKWIGNWLDFFQSSFIVLIPAPAFDRGWTRLVPLAHGSALLQRTMVDRVQLWSFLRSILPSSSARPSHTSDWDTSSSATRCVGRDGSVCSGITDSQPPTTCVVAYNG